MCERKGFTFSKSERQYYNDQSVKSFKNSDISLLDISLDNSHKKNQAFNRAKKSVDDRHKLRELPGPGHYFSTKTVRTNTSFSIR